MSQPLTQNEPCAGSMTLVEPTAADQAKVTAATLEKVLPDWANSCDEGFADCSRIWNATVGAARGIELN